jgi:hypothetical protein
LDDIRRRTQAIDASLREAAQTQQIRRCIAAFGALIFLGMVLSIHLSTLGVSFGTHVYGTNPIWPGHDATFRITAFDPHRSRPVKGLKVHLMLQSEGRTLWEGRSEAHELAEIRLKIPQEIGPKPELRVHVDTPLGQDHTLIPLTRTSKPGPMLANISHHHDALSPKLRRHHSTTHIDLYPQGGQAVSGLLNTIHGRVSNPDSTQPLRITSDKLKLDTITSAQGIFQFDYRPPLKPEYLVFQMDDLIQKTIKVPLEFRPLQLLLDVQPGPWLKPGQTIDVRVSTLPFRRPFSVDLWLGNVLLLGSTAPPDKGQRQLEITLPKKAEGPLRISAYKFFWYPEDSLSTQTYWMSSKSPVEASADALAWIRNLPGSDPSIEAALSAPPAKRPALVALALSRIKPQKPGMPLLRSTLERRQAQVYETINGARSHIHLFILMTFFFGLGVATIWAFRHQQRVKKSVRSVFEEGVASGEDIDTEQMHRITKNTHTTELVMLIFSLLLFIYGLWVLLTSLNWLGEL